MEKFEEEDITEEDDENLPDSVFSLEQEEQESEMQIEEEKIQQGDF